MVARLAIFDVLFFYSAICIKLKCLTVELLSWKTGRADAEKIFRHSVGVRSRGLVPCLPVGDCG